MSDPLDVFFPKEEELAQGDRDNIADDVFKKWFRSKDKSGFLSLRTWLDAGKVSVDIGETGNQGLKSNTQVWANAVEMVTYLRAVYDGKGKAIFGPHETFMHYGGATVDGKPVSRILKIEHWSTGSGDNKKYDESAFAWKCGHFEARKAESGAFIPDMSKSLSQNLIKVTRKEMAEVYYRLDLAINAFATQTEDVFKALNGNKK